MTRQMRVGCVVLMALILAALFASALSPAPFDELALAERLSPPSWANLFGRDELGSDILTRTLYGARLSLAVGSCVTAVSLVAGTVVGMIAGLFGGVVDGFLMRLIDILQAFPGILLAIALTAILGPGIGNVIFALSVLGWVGFARLARGQVLAEREKDYVQAARAVGVGKPRLLFSHLLPNIAAPLIVQATFGMGGVMLAEASLSFLGLGVQGYPSWGAMVNDGTDYLLTAPHIALFPGLALAMSILGLNLLGDGLRDWLDPHQRENPNP